MSPVYFFDLSYNHQLPRNSAILSTRGLGRYDLLMRPRNSEDRGIIMEFKAAETPEDMEAALDDAEKQMAERAYGVDLEQAGVKLRSEIAVAFCGKQVAIRGREIAS